MTRNDRKSSHPTQTLNVTWQSASLLLDYPDETLLGNLAMLRAASQALPDPIRSSNRYCARTRAASSK